jgi:hypothetical protein
MFFSFFERNVKRERSASDQVEFIKCHQRRTPLPKREKVSKEKILLFCFKIIRSSASKYLIQCVVEMRVLMSEK